MSNALATHETRIEFFPGCVLTYRPRYVQTSTGVMVFFDLNLETPKGPAKATISMPLRTFQALEASLGTGQVIKLWKLIQDHLGMRPVMTRYRDEV